MPHLAFINSNVCPPDGFRYTVPETGYVAHAWTYDAWIADALHHYRGNNMEVPDQLETLMQHQLCQTLEPGWCNYDDPNRPRVNLSLNWDDVKNGLATFSRWIATGMSYVPKKEAERRALICSRCYMNTNVSGCSACQAAVEAITKSRKTKHDQYLRACGVCKCLLKAKVHFPLSTLDKDNPGVQELYPGFCWLKQNGPNRVEDSDHVPD